MKKLLIFICALTLGLSANGQSLHLYGGDNHDVYLGCLNCDSYNSSSIWNAFGTYGSAFNTNSIWNQYGKYSSDYSSYSPWNAYASDGPVVVDKEGNFYGYFTINQYKGKRATFGLALNMYKYYEEIRKDVSGWYDKLFD